MGDGGGRRRRLTRSHGNSKKHQEIEDVRGGDHTLNDEDVLVTVPIIESWGRSRSRERKCPISPSK